MEKFNNMQNIQEGSEKKSYKEPQLKKIDSIGKLTLSNKTGSIQDGNPSGNKFISYVGLVNIFF